MSEILGIFGLQGWGKTALTTYLGILCSQMGIPIYSNYPLKNIDYTPVTTLEQAKSCRNGCLLMDEIWKWVHARTSQSKINKEMMSICLLNRKRGVDPIIYNSQLPRTVDVILKDVTTYRYLPHIVKNEDNTRYIHYIVKDILDRESDEMIIPIDIKILGKYFDTRYEIDDLTTNPGLTPLQKGIGLEKDFGKAVLKCKGVNDVQVIPNSGNGSGWRYDVIVYANNGNYAFDVKSATTHVFLKEYGEKLLDKIENAKKHNSFSYLAFPNNKYKRLSMPKAWYVYKLTNDSYLKRLSSNPRYNKIRLNSKRLNDLQFI